MTVIGQGRVVVVPGGRSLHVGGRRVPTTPHPLHLSAFSPNLSAFGTIPDATHYGEAPQAQACLSDILGNDTLGDCTEADQFHRQALRQAAAGAPVYHPELAVVVGTYSRDGGYVAGDPATDQGCDETVVLGNAVSKGIASSASSVNRAAGYLLVDPTDRPLVRAAVTAFVGASICMGLPNAWTASLPNASGWHWSVPKGGWTPNPDSGHCYTLLDQCEWDLKIGSWGMHGGLDYDALAAGCTVAGGGALYVELDEDVIRKGIAAAPDGLDWRCLVQAFDAAGGKIPVPASAAAVAAPSLLDRLEAWLGRTL